MFMHLENMTHGAPHRVNVLTDVDPYNGPPWNSPHDVDGALLEAQLRSRLEHEENIRNFQNFTNMSQMVNGNERGPPTISGSHLQNLLRHNSAQVPVEGFDFSEGFIELNDINSGASSMTLDDYFDSEALLHYLDTPIIPDTTNKADCRFSVSASQESHRVLMHPPPSVPLGGSSSSKRNPRTPHTKNSMVYAPMPSEFNNTRPAASILEALHSRKAPKKGSTAYDINKMDGTGTSAGEASGARSSQPHKRSRDPTMCYKVYQRKEMKAKLQEILNEYDQPIGDEASMFISFLGTIACDSILAPINYTDWRHLSKERKDRMWERVLTYYKVDPNNREWVIRSIGESWAKWKYDLKAKFFDSFPTEQECMDAAKKETRVNIMQFMTLMDYWKSEVEQIQSIRNKKIHTKQKMSHTMGTKSFAQLRNEMQLQGETSAPPTQAKLFIRTHTHKDGQLVDAASQQINKMNAHMTDLPEGFQDNTNRDGVNSQVMRDGELLRLIKDLQSENAKLKNKLGDTMATNHQRMDAMAAQLMRPSWNNFQGPDQ